MIDPEQKEILHLVKRFGSISVCTKKSKIVNSLGRISSKRFKKNKVLHGYSCESLRLKTNKLVSMGLLTKKIRRTNYMIKINKKVVRKTTFKRRGGRVYYNKTYFMPRIINYYSINSVFKKHILRFLEGEITQEKLYNYSKFLRKQLFQYLKTDKAGSKLGKIILDKMKFMVLNFVFLNLDL